MFEKLGVGFILFVGLMWLVGFLYYFYQMITALWPKRHRYLTSKYHPAVQGGFVIGVCLFYSLLWPKTVWEASRSL